MWNLDLSKISPLLTDLKSYRPEFLPKDLIAGLSVAAVQVPTAVAYAQLAGFSPEVGLYSSILPVAVYAILGSSKQLVVGPDAATCTMVASLVAPLAEGDPAKYIALSSALSLTSGALMLIGGSAGMGFIVNFFAKPILVGFLNGVAASIIVGQMGKFLGIHVEAGDFLPTLWHLLAHLSESSVLTLAVGVITILILTLLKRFAPHLPSSLIALLVATVGLHFFAGSNAGSVASVGHVPEGLPHIGLPSVSYHAGQGLFVSALGVVIVSFTSGMLTARSFASRAKTGLDANREMCAIGAANFASGLSGGFAITGADSRTAVNYASGSKTQLSSLFAAVATGAVAAYFAAPLGLLPLSALAAVLIFSAVQLLDFSSYRQLRRLDIFEFRLSILTTVGVLALGVLPGVAVAITFALVTILVRIYKPSDVVLGYVPGLPGFNDLTLVADSQSIPEVLIWRFDGPLVFFNSDYFKTRALEAVSGAQRSIKWFVFSLESVSQLDSTGMTSLLQLQQELASQNINLLLARPKEYMLKFRGEQDVDSSFPDTHVFRTISAAVEFAQSKQES